MSFVLRLCSVLRLAHDYSSLFGSRTAILNRMKIGSGGRLEVDLGTTIKTLFNVHNVGV